MSLDVVQLHPEPDQLVYAFGGHQPLLTVDPGTVIELSTEDCYGGWSGDSKTCPARSAHSPTSTRSPGR